MKKLMIGAVCAMMAAATFAEPKVEITKAYQETPGSGIVNYTYMVSDLDAGRSYDLSIKVGAEGCDKTATIKVANVKAGVKTEIANVTELLGQAYPNVTLYATLELAAVPTDANGFDYTTDGVTFLPGDYCVVDLETGAVMEMKNVKDGAFFNQTKFKTTMMAFRYVPAGKFKAKCAKTTGYTDLVANDVTLSAYWIAVFPVTDAQYGVLMGGTTTYETPKSMISWNDFRGGTWNGSSGTPGSSTFVGKLNAKIAAAGCKDTFDLCTSFQWERAARAGTRTDYFFSDKTAESVGTGTFDLLSEYAYRNLTSTTKVGTKKANAWGLYDVYGNTADWCLDWLGTLDGVTPGTDYAGPTSGEQRVYRGGESFAAAGNNSSVSRHGYAPDKDVLQFYGFRLVRKPAK